MTKRPTLLMPGKRLLNDGGAPIPRPFVSPPTPGWHQNPANPNEHVKSTGALAFSVTQNLNVPGGGQITLVRAMHLAANRAAGHYFKEPVEAFAYCDLVLDAAMYAALPADELDEEGRPVTQPVDPDVMPPLRPIGDSGESQPEVSNSSLDTKPDKDDTPG